MRPHTQLDGGLTATVGITDVAVRIRHNADNELWLVEAITSRSDTWTCLHSEPGSYSPGRLTALEDLMRDVLNPARIADALNPGRKL